MDFCIEIGGEAGKINRRYGYIKKFAVVYARNKVATKSQSELNRSFLRCLMVDF